MKVLVVTPWWPPKSHCLPAYYEGISHILKSGIPHEVFITTKFCEFKGRSIVEALEDAGNYAVSNGFTHLLTVEMDKVIPKGLLQAGLSHDKPVVLFNDRGAPWSDQTGFQQLDYSSLVDAGVGWGVMLVTTEVLKKAPFSTAFAGDFMSPDHLWFKRALQLGVEVWRDADVYVKTLEQPSALVVAGGM